MSSCEIINKIIRHYSKTDTIKVSRLTNQSNLSQFKIVINYYIIKVSIKFLLRFYYFKKIFKIKLKKLSKRKFQIPDKDIW